MRTKTLLLAAAAIAVGVASSMAQSNVYSVNVVGYMNTPITGLGKYTLISNPFDNGTNSLVSLVDPNGTVPAKTQVLIWNGTGWTIIGKTAGGWGSNPVIPQGAAFFIKTATTTPNYNNLFVGQFPTSNSMGLPTGYTPVGGMIPFSGDITTDTNIALGAILPAKSQLYLWNGAAQTYTIVGKTAGGWGAAAPITGGQGWLVKPFSAVTWTQKLY